MKITLGNRNYSTGRPLVMGILNVTPDSFSDGGEFANLDAALRHAETMVTAGADIIDVGGESSRPGAVPVAEAEELDRVLPVIEALTDRFDVAVSIDTSKPVVMQKAVDAGAVLINDVYALRQPGALRAACDTGASVCLMHMQGTPGNMQDDPYYRQLPGDVIDFLEARITACTEAGMERSRLLVDPGFGFGKNRGHNLEILANLGKFAVLGCPLLVGLSRKKTLGELTGRSVDERLAAGIAAATIAMQAGARILRTHDVGETVDAVSIFVAIQEYGQLE